MNGLNDTTCFFFFLNKSRLCLKTIYPIKLYIGGKNVEVVAHKLTDVLEKIISWLNQCHLKLNVSKTVSQSVGVPSLATRGHSLWVIVCVFWTAFPYCQRFIIDIDTLASPYVYLVRFVFSCVSIAFCSCVAFFVDYVFLDSENKAPNASFCVSIPWQNTDTIYRSSS